MRPGTTAIAAALVFAGCETGFHQDSEDVRPLDGPPASVITPLHYFESGRRAVAGYLADHAERRETAARAMEACVRIEIRVAMKGLAYSEVQGSGFLISGRRVLTSGHSLSGSSPRRIRVTLRDGRSFDARRLESSFEEFASTNLDLALLQLDTDEDLPMLEIGAPRTGDTVIVAGYPGKHGINEAGLIVSGHAYRDDPLEPLVTVAVVGETSPVVLRPIVGSIPTGGMSGSPVVDSHGRAVGIFNQVIAIPEEGGVTYAYGASSSLEWPAEFTGGDG